MSPRISWQQIASWLDQRDRIGVGLGAGLGMALGTLWRGWPSGLLIAALCAAALAITLIDLRQHRIPDRLSLPLSALGLLYSALTASPWPNVAAMAAVWGALTALREGFLRLRRKHGLGGGDVKLMAAAAAWLPIATLPTYILAASITGLIDAALRCRQKDKPIAFGAHLAPWLVLFVLFD